MIYLNYKGKRWGERCKENKELGIKFQRRHN